MVLSEKQDSGLGPGQPPCVRDETLTEHEGVWRTGEIATDPDEFLDNIPAISWHAHLFGPGSRDPCGPTPNTGSPGKRVDRRS
jgi:hypothetical protein